ncbi:TPA: hypothetical protein MIN89_07615 [Klebsiella pneumoniae]|nr:hypothetical protein [Klebsiella pneumoniae]
MARPKTAQPNHSLRKVAAVVATAVSGMSVYAQAAEQPKQEETITVARRCCCGCCRGCAASAPR